MTKFLTAVLLLSFGASAIFGQNPNRIYKGFKLKETRLEVYTSDGVYVFTPYAPQVIETAFVPEGEVLNTQSWSVTMLPGKVAMDLVESDDGLTYRSPGMGVTIIKRPFQIQYFYNDRPLISEKSGYIKTDTSKEIEFNLNPHEVLYGGGTRVLGMNRRGNRLELYNKAHYGYTSRSELMNYCIPMMLSSERYAIHFDNAPIGFLDFDSKGNNTLKYETVGGRMVYQVIAADTWPEVMNALTQLTGKQPLPPRWVLGNFSSRFGYHSEQETRMTVSRFIEDSIPLDAVVIDIYWFGPDIFGYMGNLEFYADSFPTPDKMMADFKSLGVKTVLVTEPFILTTSDRWAEAVDHKILATDSIGNPYTYDFYFGNTGLIDIFKPSARQWFWNIYKNLTERGVAGWWGDLGEPEVHPAGLQHVNGSANEVHNVYGHAWAKMIFEGYKHDFPDQRPFILMRSGAAGSQHYGMIPWTGDVDRSWGGLKPQTELSLQMGMQGLAYLHSDAGGFANGVTFDAGLYTRWLQYAVFQPLFRPHAQEHIAAEPVFHDTQTKALAKKAIELRYSMLPYNYTLAFENSQTGMPFMRPLFFQEPENEALLLYDKAYLWGADLLVSPVTDSAAVSQQVYFPGGNNWFDLYTGQQYAGGTAVDITLQPQYIPVFARGGAIIPRIAPVMNTDQYTTRQLQLHFYFDPQAENSFARLYDDDGITPGAYEKGLFELLHFEATSNEAGFVMKLSSNRGHNYPVTGRNIELMVLNVREQPQLVKLSGTELPFSYNPEKSELFIQFNWNSEQEQKIEVNF